ncbi:MAG: NapC/NirT family cytochrome c [Pseudomonadota bacterium]
MKLRTRIFMLGLWATLLAAPVLARPAVEAGGFSLMRGIGVAACVLGIAGILIVRYLGERGRLPRGTYNMLLLLVLLVLPSVALVATTQTVFVGMKAPTACASCHVMEPYLEDMQDPASASLSAAHFRNGWIPRDQCYSCHVTYGATGSLEGKRDGARHWILYVTGTHADPIRYTGSYPNINCLGCHDGTPGFSRVLSHQAINEHLRSDEMSCVSCHGPPHPRGEAGHLNQ